MLNILVNLILFVVVLCLVFGLFLIIDSWDSKKIRKNYNRKLNKETVAETTSKETSCETIRKNEIDEIIYYLYSQFKNKRLRINKVYYEIPRSIYNQLIENPYSYGALQKLINDMVLFSGAVNKISIYVIDDIGDDHKAATYKAQGFHRGEIYLSRNNNYKINHIMAILAHECAHNFLYQYGISVDNSEEKNEILADVATIFLGFGELIQEGYKDWLQSFTIGYLSFEEIYYVRQRFAKIKEEEEEKKEGIYKKHQYPKAQEYQYLESTMNTAKLLLEQNETAVNYLIEKENEISIQSQDMDIIMENINSFYRKEIKDKIQDIENKIKSNSDNSGSISNFYKLVTEIDTLSAKLSYWNSILSKYI